MPITPNESAAFTIVAVVGGIINMIVQGVDKRKDRAEVVLAKQLVDSSAMAKIKSDEEISKQSILETGLAHLIHGQNETISRQTREITRQSEQIDELKQDLKEFRKEFAVEVEERKKYQASAAEAHKRADDAETKLKELQERLLKIQNENTGLLYQTEDQHKHIKELQEEISNLQTLIDKLNTDVHAVANQEITTTTITTVAPKPTALI